MVGKCQNGLPKIGYFPVGIHETKQSRQFSLCVLGKQTTYKGLNDATSKSRALTKVKLRIDLEFSSKIVI